MTALHTKHTVPEKIFFRSFIYGSYAIATWAIFKENAWFALIYACFAAISLIWVSRTFCSHCPTPCTYSDCLMVPFPLTKLIFKHNPKPMGFMDRMSFPLVMLILLPLIPQYWLFQDRTLFIVFWLLFSVAWSSMLLFKCRFCRFNECPLNITKRMA